MSECVQTPSTPYSPASQCWVLNKMKGGANLEAELEVPQALQDRSPGAACMLADQGKPLAAAGSRLTMGHVLIVDDSRTSLMKINAAVTAPGYSTATAEDGETALRLLSGASFDMVLLDIVMPGLSGFDVLAAMKSNEGLRHVPVVVISSLNDDMASVARAIALGADDFLPKDFDQFILRARVGAGVERKRLRDVEISYLDQVARLTKAAELLESGRYDPRKLDLEDVMARPDGLGKLAAVFMSMAQKVYDRERTLTARAAALGESYQLSGLALVMLAAALWATVGVASELLPSGLSVPDEVYGFARTVVAGPAILFLTFVTGGARTCVPQRGSMTGFLAFGICCAIFQICLFRSFGLIGVTVTVFLTVCLPPVLAMAFALWRRTEAVSSYTVMALGFAALGLMTFIGNDLTDSNVSALLGLMLSLTASVAFVLMTQAARALAADHSPMLVSGLGLIITAAILAPVAFLLSPVDWPALVTTLSDWRSLGMLLYLGLGPTALAYICYCVGMARCRSALTGLVASTIEPAVAAGLAFLFLGETLTVWRSLGCLTMLLAMTTLWFGEKRMVVNGKEAKILS